MNSIEQRLGDALDQVRTKLGGPQALAPTFPGAQSPHIYARGADRSLIVRAGWR